MESRSQVIHWSSRPMLEAVKILIVLFSLVQYSLALPTSHTRDNEDFALKLHAYIARNLPHEQDSVITSATDKLISMGVYRLDELKYATEDDLLDVFHLIQVRELLAAIKKDFSVNGDKEEIPSNMKPIPSAEQLTKQPDKQTNNEIPVNNNPVVEHDVKIEYLPMAPERKSVAPIKDTLEHTDNTAGKLRQDPGNSKSLSDDSNDNNIPDLRKKESLIKSEVNNTFPSEQQIEHDVPSHVVSSATNDDIPNEIKTKLSNKWSMDGAEHSTDIAPHETLQNRHIVPLVATSNLSETLNSSQNSENKYGADTSHPREYYANDKRRSEYKTEDSKKVDYETKHYTLTRPDASGKVDNDSDLHLQNSDNNLTKTANDMNASDKLLDTANNVIDQSGKRMEKYNENMKDDEFSDKVVTSLDKNPGEVVREENSANKFDFRDKQITDLSTDYTKNVIKSQTDTVGRIGPNEIPNPQKTLASAEYSDDEDTDSPIDNGVRDQESVFLPDEDQIPNQRIIEDDSDLIFRQPSTNKIQNDRHASANDGENNIGMHSVIKLRKTLVNDNVTFGSMNFMTYFVIVSILVAIGYVGLHNKQKIVAVILEGRKGRGKREKGSTEASQPLVAEVLATSEKPPSVKNFIY